MWNQNRDTLLDTSLTPLWSQLFASSLEVAGQGKSNQIAFSRVVLRHHSGAGVVAMYWEVQKNRYFCLQLWAPTHSKASWGLTHLLSPSRPTYCTVRGWQYYRNQICISWKSLLQEGFSVGGVSRSYISLYKGQESLSLVFLPHCLWKMPSTSLNFWGVKNENLKYFFSLLRRPIPMPFLQIPVLWNGQSAQTASSEQQFLSHWGSGIGELGDLGLQQGMRRDYYTAQWDPQLQTPNFREKIWKLKHCNEEVWVFLQKKKKEPHNCWKAEIQWERHFVKNIWEWGYQWCWAL